MYLLPYEQSFDILNRRALPGDTSRTEFIHVFDFEGALDIFEGTLRKKISWGKGSPVAFGKASVTSWRGRKGERVRNIIFNVSHDM